MFFKDKESVLRAVNKARLTSLKNDIDETLAQIRTIENNYQYMNDGDLIESSIYELNALKAKYRYLFKQARLLGLHPEVKPPEIKFKKTVKEEDEWNLISTQ